MEQVERIGVSFEKNLLSQFDKLIQEQGYQSRSEAIRDLIRERLSRRLLEHPGAKAVATVSIVYDHHSTELMKKLTSLQHNQLLQTICTMHVHLDHHDCMEVICLKGKVEQINKMADQLLAQKGVKLGKVNIIHAGTAE
ncbi:MAG: nickel-responsive transcriptional regulator NikR [Candidatus Brocadiia bacterium]|nr:MAG: nickel-responsive transcriptional regulator NikR [Candidatus Brocadiia bacterium]